MFHSIVQNTQQKVILQPNQYQTALSSTQLGGAICSDDEARQIAQRIKNIYNGGNSTLSRNAARDMMMDAYNVLGLSLTPTDQDIDHYIGSIDLNNNNTGNLDDFCVRILSGRTIYTQEAPNYFVNKQEPQVVNRVVTVSGVSQNMFSSGHQTQWQIPSSWNFNNVSQQQYAQVIEQRKVAVRIWVKLFGQQEYINRDQLPKLIQEMRSNPSNTPVSQREMEAFLKDFDTNRDGRISLSEFQDGISKSLLRYASDVKIN